MLKSLRWKLTLAFLGVTLLFVLVIGGSAYISLNGYFEASVDLSLRHKMATQFQLFGFSLPAELAAAEIAWAEEQLELTGGQPQGEGTENEENEDPFQEQHEILENSLFTDTLTIFVLPLNQKGELLFNPNGFPPPMQPDVAASEAAQQTGRDARYVPLANGERVRLLSYLTNPGEEPAVIQVGRLLDDQDQVLRQVATSTAMIGALMLALVGAGGWWLAGLTLIPAQNAWDQQQTFVANASHELRTPLTLLRASTEVALRAEHEPKKAQLLQDTLVEADYMSLLVDDLLLLSRLDGKRLTLEMEPVSIGELLREVRSAVRNMPGGGSISIQENAAGRVAGDRGRLRQVILALLDNAVKHNPAGTAVHVFSERKNKSIELVIEDHGSGIDSKRLPHIFERFYHSSSGDAHVHSSGLGLSIVKGLVELHRGSIRVESKVGAGTRFIVSLPESL